MGKNDGKKKPPRQVKLDVATEKQLALSNTLEQILKQGCFELGLSFQDAIAALERVKYRLCATTENSLVQAENAEKQNQSKIIVPGMQVPANLRGN